ncbi:MAG: DUF3352 domain-containing protein [Cyanobacteria bacterium P01_H01_bin.15]
MKRSVFNTILLSVVVGLLVTAALSFSWLLRQSPWELRTGGVVRLPRSAMFIPQQAPLMVSLLVNPDRLENYAQLGTRPVARRAAHQKFNQLRNTLLVGTGLEYDRDLKGWLGEEVTLAITTLDRDRNPSNGAQPGYLLITQAQDAGAAKLFVQGTFTQAALITGGELSFETYQGVELISQRQPQGRQLSSAAIDDTVLFANGPDVLRSALNTVQAPSLSLAETTDYQSALNAITEPRIAIAYGNLPDLSAWLLNDPNASEPELTQLLTLTLGVTPEGLALQTALPGMNTASATVPFLTGPVEALNWIPPQSELVATGQNLAELWQQIQTELPSASPINVAISQWLGQLQATLPGLDLAQDIFAWTTEDYAIALLPSTERTFDWLFVARKTPTSSTALAHLDELAAAQKLSVGKIPLNQTTPTVWTQLVTQTAKPGQTELNAQVAGAHVDSGGYILLASSLPALQQALQTRSFLDNPGFQGAIQALPRTNNGYVYADWQHGKPLFEHQLPLLRLLEASLQPLFEQLRSLTITSLGREKGVQRSTVFLDLEA